MDQDKRVETVNFVASDSALRVIAESLASPAVTTLSVKYLARLRARFAQQANADIGANIASGSYPVDAMVGYPVQHRHPGRIANGIASQFIERAADVCLKEKRRLVLCVRETPLSKIHIRNLFRAADASHRSPSYRRTITGRHH